MTWSLAGGSTCLPDMTHLPASQVQCAQPMFTHGPLPNASFGTPYSQQPFHAHKASFRRHCFWKNGWQEAKGANCAKVSFIMSIRPSQAVQCPPVLGAAVQAICYDKGIDSFHFYVSVAFPKGEMSREPWSFLVHIFRSLETFNNCSKITCQRSHRRNDYNSVGCLYWHLGLVLMIMKNPLIALRFLLMKTSLRL